MVGNSTEQQRWVTPCSGSIRAATGVQRTKVASDRFWPDDVIPRSQRGAPPIQISRRTTEVWIEVWRLALG